jgi:predicted acetyltransferase
VGRSAGEPVCTASLFLTPPVAGIYFVSTLGQHRRHGFGGAMTRHLLDQARALGCRSAILGSSPMGYGLYRSLGFEEVFRYRLLEWPSASG